jgi:hypothetical protein
MQQFHSFMYMKQRNMCHPLTHIRSYRTYNTASSGNNFALHLVERHSEVQLSKDKKEGILHHPEFIAAMESLG